MSSNASIHIKTIRSSDFFIKHLILIEISINITQFDQHVLLVKWPYDQTVWSEGWMKNYTPLPCYTFMKGIRMTKHLVQFAYYALKTQEFKFKLIRRILAYSLVYPVCCRLSNVNIFFLIRGVYPNYLLWALLISR